ncbi:MAG: hypothetical protein ABI629_24215 [bacterium]
MTTRALRWLLWLAFVLFVPLPYFMVEIGRVPAAQLFMFAAVTTPLLFTDFGFTTQVVAGLFLLQSFLFGLLLWLLAVVVVRYLPVARQTLIALALVAALAGLALAPVYRAPLSAGPLPTNWFGLWR